MQRRTDGWTLNSKSQKVFFIRQKATNFLLLFVKDEIVASLADIRTLSRGGVSGLRCVEVYLLPRAQPAQRMERGEGREANWLSHPLRRERETERKRRRKRETAGRQDVDGRKDTAMLTGCVYGGSDNYTKAGFEKL